MDIHDHSLLFPMYSLASLNDKWKSMIIVKVVLAYTDIHHWVMGICSRCWISTVSRVGGCERVFTPVRWRQVRLSCIKWRSTFFLYFFVRPSFGRQFVIRLDGCCANCDVGLAFLPSGHTMWKQRHDDVRNDAITTSCARWVGLWGRPVSLV